jgi:hypothetical protein
MEQRQPLPGVEQQRISLGRLYQGGKAVFTKCSVDGTDGVLAEYGDAMLHLQQLFFGKRGTPIFARMLNMGQNWVKPDWNRFSPTKPVNQSQLGLWKCDKASEIKINVPATILTMRSM